MNRKFKAFGLALFAAFALSAVVASAASAAKDHITASEAGSLEAKNVQGEIGGGFQEFRATTNETGKRVVCKKINVNGSVTKGINTSITVEPKYSECTAFNEGTEAAATVTTEGCHYTFTGETTSGNPTGHEHATVDIVNKSGSCTHINIDVTALKLKCISVPVQEVKDSVVYENDPTNEKAIIVRATAHNITSTTTNSVACPTKSGETEVHPEGGLYTGEATVTSPTAALRVVSTP